MKPVRPLKPETIRPIRGSHRVRRNAPCPYCNSGRKYKRCCMRRVERAIRELESEGE